MKRRKYVEGILQQIRGFCNPRVELEQYVTPSEIAASMLATIDEQFDDIAGRRVADLGTGTGVLAMGCTALDADYVIGVDVDADALRVARENVQDFDFGVDFLLADVTKLSAIMKQRFDTVVMNPPFGTKNNIGADVRFLEAALSVGEVVYSLHKTSTRNFVRKVCEQRGASVEFLAELRYDLPKTYKFHRRNSVDIQVDFIRVENRSFPPVN
ncbi:unnamed protein product [Notodromas monacha]|uniref:Methyltransferase-like protein 5 n=1 Tax=Notodromas monacha TaxID=399045 RepID=A0A7R9BHH8_9CRUS|nr:unnamed protein product [Notodromas monacha]CAG0914551.1 unnamed protein product [Notodromas monacha]